MRIRVFVSVLAAGAVVALGIPELAVAAPGAAPGTVVSTEELPRERWIPGTGQATAVTYWTAGPSGVPALSSGAVYLPEGPTPAGGWPVISWAHGTVGLGDSCAPSLLSKSARDSKYLAHWMSRGFAIVASDYVGLGTPGVHPYLDGRSAATNVIDMVRAGRSVSDRLSARWMVIGQSQGGQAALLTANTATRYAPELDFRGTLATGAPSNLELLFPVGGPYIPDLGLDGLTVFTSYIFAGMRAAKPEFDVDRYLTPLGKEIVADAEVLCYDEQAERVSGVSVGAMLGQPLGDPGFRQALNDYLSVPTAGYDRPIFIGQGLLDTTVPAPMSFKLAPELLAGGVHVTYRPYPTDHSGTMTASLPDSTPFVTTLFREASASRRLAVE